MVGVPLSVVFGHRWAVSFGASTSGSAQCDRLLRRSTAGVAASADRCKLSYRV